VLAPGAYPDLGTYAGRISSIRPVDGRQSRNRDDERGGTGGARNALRRFQPVRALLFARPGDAEPVPSGFNDRASSLRVESGYWIFCSDAEFRGECRTFGPGDYSSIPNLNNVISSGRRISNAYPYQDQPNWQRNAYGPSPTYDNRR
jgi:hypothetical protein